MPRPLPSFLHAPEPEVSARARWQGPAVIIALALLLLLQGVLAQRTQLAADARWRPMLSTVCVVVRCELPAWQEPAAITLVRRDIRPHPAHPGVLQVTASFRNDARWPQPWPALQLTLSDVDGRALGTRTFQPREYLAHPTSTARIASGQVVDIAMDILEPAPGVVAFTFDFH